MVNIKQIKVGVNHIETVHSEMYNLTSLRWFRDNQKSLVRICEKNIKELHDKIKTEKNQLKEYKAKHKVYVKVVELKEKKKAQQSFTGVSSK